MILSACHGPAGRRGRWTPGALRRRSARARHHPPRDDLKPGLHRDLPGLTPRELDGLRLPATGLSNAELTGQLPLSVATVKTHIAGILSEPGLRDRLQPVVVAYEPGPVSPGGTG
ncbi:LuxR C-terminal-related transcriptional regulator [Nonomuraea rubra]